MNSSIKKVEYYLPEHIVTNKHIEGDFPGWSSDMYEKKIGIRQRHIATENETALNLAFESSKKVLNGYDKNKIDFIILCTQSPDYFLPSSACILQAMLGLRTDVGAFDYNLGCSGYIYGLAIAKGLISAGVAENILLVMAETYSKYLYSKDRGNRIIFGDGAAATIIERSINPGVFNFILGTDGSGYNKLIVRNGGMRNKYDANTKEIEYSSESITTDNHLYMNGPDIFNFTIQSVPEVVNTVLNKHDLGMEDIDYVIFHQANKYMLNYLRTKIGIAEEKFYINMIDTGNTVSATIPIALKDCLEKKIVKQGDKVLLVGFGVGYSWGATIIVIN
jgi:3-oxoacyl-[acyl-carrier-protein] synthase III